MDEPLKEAAPLDTKSMSTEELTPLFTRFLRWEREGTLENLEQVLRAVSALMDILSPELVEKMVRMVASALELADTVAHSEVLPIVAMLQDVEGLLSNPPSRSKHEVRQLMKSLRDPDVQNGVELALGLLKLVGSRTSLRADTDSKAETVR